MKICFLVDRAQAGTGPHRHVVELLNGLAILGKLDVLLLTNKVDNEELFVKSPKIKISLGFNPHQTSVASIVRNLIFIRRACIEADIIYVPTGLKTLFYAQVLKPKPIIAGPNVTPLSYISRGNDAPSFIELRLLSDYWVEASQIRRNIVIRIAGRKYADKIIVIPHGVDTDIFNPVWRQKHFWEKYSIPPYTTKVIFVGKDSQPLKGVNEFIGAIRILTSNEQLRNKLSFIFVGKFSQNTKLQLSDYIEKGQVYMLGFIQNKKELARIYANSDIQVVPSMWENCPFVVLEGMSSGLTVVASNAGGIPELIKDKESGIIVPIVKEGKFVPNVSQILAKTIADLALNASLRIRIGQEARITALKKFDNKRVAKDFFALFERVLEKRLNNIW